MLACAVDSKPRFVRRTSLEAGEYRTNFRQIDCDTITWLTSKKARQVSHSMSQVYLSLVNASSEYFEREGVLHFMGAEEGRKRLTGSMETIVRTHRRCQLDSLEMYQMAQRKRSYRLQCPQQWRRYSHLPESRFKIDRQTL